MGNIKDPAWYLFLAGGLGDASASIFSHPMDVTKIRMQLQGELSTKHFPSIGISHIYKNFRSIFVQEGISNGIYAGLSAAVLRQCTFSSMRHGFFGMANASYTEHFHKPMALFDQMMGGAIIGAACACITNPCDVVLVRMQADGHWAPALRRRYLHVFHGLSSIISDEGTITLWRGVSATVTRGILITCSQLPVYHSSKAHLIQTGYFSDDIKTHVLSSIASAAAASVISCPADVIKTRMMNMKTSSGGALYSGTWDCASKTLRAEGLGGFYKGLGATFARLGPHTVIMWIFQEQYLIMLRKSNIIA